MTTEYKQVPAIDKCFAVLQLFARSKQPLGISEIARTLGLYKGTVFNMVHTLANLEVLEHGSDGKFRLGTLLYTLGKTAGSRSELIQTVRPFLETINQDTKLSAFLGIRSGLRAIIVDKVDTAYDLKISSEVGMRMPFCAGPGEKPCCPNFRTGTSTDPFRKRTEAVHTEKHRGPDRIQTGDPACP